MNRLLTAHVRGRHLVKFNFLPVTEKSSDEILLIETAMNEGFNLTLKERPYYLYYGKDPRTRCKVLGQNMPGNSNEIDIVTNLRYAYMLIERELQKDRDRGD